MTTKDDAKNKGAKVPQDRAAKAEALGETIHVSFEVDGLEFSITVDQDDLDDADALDDFNINKMPGRLYRILAGEQREQIDKAFRDADAKGRVKVSDQAKFVVAAMQAVGQGKSSASPRS